MACPYRTLVLALVIAAAVLFTGVQMMAGDSSSDSGPFSDKRGDGSGEGIEVEYYTTTSGIMRPAVLFRLDSVPPMQLSVTIGSEPPQQVEPIESRPLFAVFLERALTVENSPYPVLVSKFGDGGYVASCLLYLYEDYCTVDFDPNGGSGSMESREVGAGSTLTLPSNGFVPPAGMQFSCWRIGSDTYSVGQTVRVDSDITVRAVWTSVSPSTYTIRTETHPEGWGTAEGSGSYGSGASCTLSAHPNEGYQFSKWVLDGATVSTDEVYTATVWSDATYSAYFIQSGEPMTAYSLSYSANGGTGAPPTQTETSYNQTYTFTVSDGEPSLEGRTFAGWSLWPNGPVRYTGGDFITLYSYSPQITLYASWSGGPVSGVRMTFDSVTIGVGSKLILQAEVIPEDATDRRLTWTTSDGDIVAVSADGTITALREGTVTVTVTTVDGGYTATCTVTVVPEGEDIIGIMDTGDGGAVEETIRTDTDGNIVSENPVVIRTGDAGISYEQEKIALEITGRTIAAGENPHVVIVTERTWVDVPESLTLRIVSGNGSLTFISGHVKLYFPYRTIEGLDVPYSGMSIHVVPMRVKDTGHSFKGFTNIEVYDIFIMINGVRATDVFHEPVTVTLEYPLKGKQVPEKVSVFHIDGKELEAIGFDYIEGEGVRFDAAHFSLYLIGYEGHLSGDRDWIFEISVAMVFLLSMYILIAALRRDDDDEEEHK